MKNKKHFFFERINIVALILLITKGVLFLIEPTDNQQFTAIIFYIATFITVISFVYALLYNAGRLLFITSASFLMIFLIQVLASLVVF